MSVLSLIRVNVGDVGVKPGSVKMVSTANLATVTAAGYINGAGLQVQPQVLLAPSDVVECLYNYNASDDSGSLVYLRPSVSNGVITLVVAPDADSIALAVNKIFVGDAAGLAVGVAMSGDVAILASGATTIQAGAIDLAMLSSGITPSDIIKYSGKEADGGGSATIAITVTGVAATDKVFAQVQGSTNAVEVQKVTPTTNTITVLLSADPGASTTIAYQVLRSAA